MKNNTLQVIPFLSFLKITKFLVNDSGLIKKLNNYFYVALSDQNYKN